MWTDNETDRDFLNFTGVADTVAEIIVQAAGRPISIGVSGAWGVGKSSLIKLIRKSLEKRPKEESEKYIFVEFNAWLYQGYDDARAALMEVIAAHLKHTAEERKTGVEKAKELLQRVNWLRVAKLTTGSLAALACGLPPVGLVGDAYSLLRGVIGAKPDQGTIKQGEAFASELGTAATGLIKAKTEASPPEEIHAIRETFEATLKELGVTLVVLIDDLDRCLPETTISTLEAIRLFLFLKNAAFVIAADEAMIKHAVKQHFPGVEEGLVTNYFDKLIQVPIRVPPLGTQEVRGYMMLLFIDNGTLPEAVRDTVRLKVCEQLSHSWQGKRVDKAFVASLIENPPPDLVTQLDSADRLAPIMATASKIAGNPRLIKRFLNALSIRRAMARIHGVTVDEAALAKMLLFERCGDSKAFAALVRAINEDAEGKPRFLTEWEEKAVAGEEQKLETPWNDSFVPEWLALPPRLADIDLRGVLYVSRENFPLISPQDRLSSEAAEVLTALLEHPDMAAQLKDRVVQLAPTELNALMDRLLEKAQREQAWGVPPILEACLLLADCDTAQAARLAAFLGGLPPSQIQPDIVPKLSDRVWAQTVFAAWKSGAVSSTVKRAITQRSKNGNVTV